MIHVVVGWRTTGTGRQEEWIGAFKDLQDAQSVAASREQTDSDAGWKFYIVSVAMMGQ